MCANIVLSPLSDGITGTCLLKDVKVGKFDSDLAVSERILLVRHLGSELSSSILVEEFVSNLSKYLLATLDKLMANIRQPSVG